MQYLIVEKFGPFDDRWPSYAQWAGLEHCVEYGSIDGIMRKSLFNPESAEDWKNCVNENGLMHIITNLAYAQKILPKFKDAEIVGIIIDPRSSKEDNPANHPHLGFDIIEGGGSISLITNWGGKEQGVPNLKLNQYALIHDVNDAYRIRDFLRDNFEEDHHAQACEVWSIFRV